MLNITKPKILIVEDEAIVAANIADRLEEDGYEVTGIADSGADAIAYAQVTAPDLVLMDIVLKGDIDGITAAEAIHSRLAIPIIYMTAYSDEKTLQRSKSAQPLAYLIKPFRTQELKATIEIALNKHQFDLQQSQALQSSVKLQAETQALSDFKSTFISMISHEFRNPLTNINLSADLLETQSGQWSEPKKQERFQRIRKAIAQMTALLDDALALTKVESGNSSLNPQDFNLYEFCLELTQDLQVAAGDRYQIQCFSNNEDRIVNLDRSLTEYILINLLSNAVKYSPNGGLIELKIDYTERNSLTKVILEVSDRGIGISAADREQLFDTFFRSPSVGTIKGNGLGLAIAKKCIEIQNGQIFVESNLGSGTTFIVVLPSSV
jgi:signal transduction histidine kinase